MNMPLQKNHHVDTAKNLNDFLADDLTENFLVAKPRRDFSNTAKVLLSLGAGVIMTAYAIGTVWAVTNEVSSSAAQAGNTVATIFGGQPNERQPIPFAPSVHISVAQLTP